MTKTEMIEFLTEDGEFTSSELNKMLKPEVEDLFNERFSTDDIDEDIEETLIESEVEEDTIEVSIDFNLDKEQKENSFKLSKAELRRLKRAGQL